MTKIQKISEEIVPLSSREGLVLGIIIACVFQFALFYAPALADEVVKQGNQNVLLANQEEMVTNGPLMKESMPNKQVIQFMKPLMANTTPATTSLAAPNFFVEELFTPEIPDISPTEEPIVSAPTINIIKTSTHVITAYNSEAAQTDDSPCITANGYNVCESGVEDTIAANFLKFGTKVQIPELFGDRVFVVRDRMNKRHADRVDVWMKDRTDAINFGIKVAQIHVVEAIN